MSGEKGEEMGNAKKEETRQKKERIEIDINRELAWPVTVTKQ